MTLSGGGCNGVAPEVYIGCPCAKVWLGTGGDDACRCWGCNKSLAWLSRCRVAGCKSTATNVLREYRLASYERMIVASHSCMETSDAASEPGIHRRIWRKFVKYARAGVSRTISLAGWSVGLDE